MIADLPDRVLKPDPLTAETPQEFVQLMRAYRAWAGDPSLRQMAARCNHKISYSAFHKMLERETLPADWQVEVSSPCSAAPTKTARGGSTPDGN